MHENDMPIMHEINERIMAFQEFLMETLYSHDDINVIQEKLAPFYRDALLASWLQSFAPAMLEVAARMTQHWGKKAILEDDCVDL